MERIVSEWITVNLRESFVFSVGLIIVIPKCRLLLPVPVVRSSGVKALILGVTRVTVVWRVVTMGIIKRHVLESIVGCPLPSITLVPGDGGFPVILWISVIRVGGVLETTVLWGVVMVIVRGRAVSRIHVISVWGISVERVTITRVIVRVSVAIITWVITIGVVSRVITIAIIGWVTCIPGVLVNLLIAAVGGRFIIAPPAPGRGISVAIVGWVTSVTRVLVHVLVAAIRRRFIITPSTSWRSIPRIV